MRPTIKILSIISLFILGIYILSSSSSSNRSSLIQKQTKDVKKAKITIDSTNISIKKDLNKIKIKRKNSEKIITHIINDTTTNDSSKAELLAKFLSDSNLYK